MYFYVLLPTFSQSEVRVVFYMAVCIFTGFNQWQTDKRQEIGYF